MINKDLQYSVEMNAKINQLRSILFSLTDEKKSSYLELLKQIDKKTVNFLMKEKHMDPYSEAMLEQLEFQMKKQKDFFYDKHIIIQEKEHESLIQNLLKEQGFHINEVESISVKSDEIMIYSIDNLNRVAIYHPTRLALQDSNSQLIGSQRYLEESQEMLRRILREKEAQKNKENAARCNDKQRMASMEGL